jgi:3-oxoacyl-[acyl-carrier protein] reductase
MLVAQLAPMLTHRGVTINALDPGPTDTGWMHEDLKQEIANAGARINRPEDIGQLVINLLTHDLSISSGEVIRAPRSI